MGGVLPRVVRSFQGQPRYHPSRPKGGRRGKAGARKFLLSKRGDFPTSPRLRAHGCAQHLGAGALGRPLRLRLFPVERGGEVLMDSQLSLPLWSQQRPGDASGVVSSAGAKGPCGGLKAGPEQERAGRPRGWPEAAGEPQKERESLVQEPEHTRLPSLTAHERELRNEASLYKDIDHGHGSEGTALGARWGPSVTTRACGQAIPPLRLPEPPRRRSRWTSVHLQPQASTSTEQSLSVKSVKKGTRKNTCRINPKPRRRL